MMNLTFAQKASNREKTVRELTSDRDRVASLLENQKRLTQAEKDAKKAAQEESKIQKKKDLGQKITIKHLNDQIAQKDAAFKAMVASLTAKLTQAGAHDKADHDAIHNLNEQLAKESDERQNLGKLLNDKKDELATKTGELEILHGQLKETEKALEASQTLVKSQEKDIATVNAAKDAANGQVGRLEAVLEQAQKHAATLKTDLEAAQKTVERLNAEKTEAAARIANLEWEIITVKATEKNPKGINASQRQCPECPERVKHDQREITRNRGE
jgi:chromosome segregation ATPase